MFYVDVFLFPRFTSASTPYKMYHVHNILCHCPHRIIFALRDVEDGYGYGGEHKGLPFLRFGVVPVLRSKRQLVRE